MGRKGDAYRSGRSWLTIRVDREIYEALSRKAVGFESPNKVLRRLLGLNGKGERKGEGQR